MSKVQVGDKINLKKEMGPFKKIGSICTVTDIGDDGSIKFESSDFPGYGVMSEDELDKYFDIIVPIEPSNDGLESLNDDELNKAAEILKNQLEKYEKAIAKRKEGKLYLGELEPGEIFLDQEGVKYIIVKHFLDCDKSAVCLAKWPYNFPYSLMLFDSNELVKRVDDQK